MCRPPNIKTGLRLKHLPLLKTLFSKSNKITEYIFAGGSIPSCRSENLSALPLIKIRKRKYFTITWNAINPEKKKRDTTVSTKVALNLNKVII